MGCGASSNSSEQEPETTRSNRTTYNDCHANRSQGETTYDLSEGNTRQSYESCASNPPAASRNRNGTFDSPSNINVQEPSPIARTKHAPKSLPFAHSNSTAAAEGGKEETSVFRFPADSVTTPAAGGAGGNRRCSSVHFADSPYPEFTERCARRVVMVSTLQKGCISSSAWIGRWTIEPPSSRSTFNSIGDSPIELQVVVKQIDVPQAVTVKDERRGSLSIRIATALADLQRFRSRLHQSMLASIHGSFMQDGRIVVCSDYMPSGSIAAQAGTLHGDALGSTLTRVAIGVRYLNTSMLLPHRHLTMNNILSTGSGCVVSDCALGSLFSSLRAKDVYSLGYRAASMFPPETINKPDDDDAACNNGEKCDVWAIGCIGYTLAFGAEPFVAETKEKLFELIATSPVTFPPDAISRFGQDFVDVLSMCLRKEPRERPTMMGMLRQDYFLAFVRNFSIASRASQRQRPSFARCNSDVCSSAGVSLLLPPVAIMSTSAPASRKVSPAISPMHSPHSPSEHHMSSPSTTPSELHHSPTESFTRPALFDVHFVDGVVYCSSCGASVRHTYLGCRECEAFILCATCAAQDVRHVPGHRLETFVIEEATDGKRCSLVLGEHANSIRRVESKFWTPKAPSVSATATPIVPEIYTALPLDLPEASSRRSSDYAVHGAPTTRSLDTRDSPSVSPSVAPSARPSFLVIPMSLMSEEEKTSFYMSGTLPPSQLQCLRSVRSLRKGGLQDRLLDVAAPSVTPESIMHECIAQRGLDLDLHDMNIVQFPQEILEPSISHITFLDLSGNGIEEIPIGIGILSALRDLRISQNSLTSLPDSIGDLSALERMDASNNKLTDLPQTLMFAESLSFMSLDYNEFNSIPEVVADIVALRTVYLAANYSISKWPPVDLFSRVDSLEIGLDNEPNLFSEYEKSLASARQMKGLTVMWNKIYPDKVIPGLFCGSLRSVQTHHVYEVLNITHVLTAGRGLEPAIFPGMRNVVMLIDDLEGASIGHVFQETFEFINDALNNGSGCVVHCFAGMSRSATACIAFLMQHRQMRLDDAYNLVRKARPAIYPNRGFFSQLISFDRQLFPDGRPLDISSMNRECIPF